MGNQGIQYTEIHFLISFWFLLCLALNISQNFSYFGLKFFRIRQNLINNVFSDFKPKTYKKNLTNFQNFQKFVAKPELTIFGCP